jgi:HEAT repeat protein
MEYLRKVTREYTHWPGVVAAVARALQECPVQGGEDILKSLLYRPDVFVRTSAASALTKTDRGLDILAGAMESPYRVVAGTAFSVLARLDKLPEDKLVEALSWPDWMLREEAVRSLAKCADLTKADWLGSALGNEDPIVRRTVAEALSNTKLEEIIEALNKGFKSDSRTRFWCIRAYAAVQPDKIWEYIFTLGTTISNGDVARRRMQEAAVAASSALGERFLILLTVEDFTDPLKKNILSGVLAQIVPGKEKNVEFWQKWLKLRNPGFRWSEKDCRFQEK